ncbi:dTDP-4-dehydrorhamnose reductase [Paenibacillus sp. MMS18-CY102]|uniref:dTDP-4-dehydrorhamnose reductase n=1 Tax=Paenibacillus sp. MMS18-CY102 TaxID=2682849 RepID=UPI00136678E4|nr:dTDP-4-dehydrorhamnose reductase [Paenibacillus sp. MMS18-CY102]MWC27631.1 dTDP-4-dehydrorhamnose reductase [Paenibacillus sp. MMS18-CY102]
MVKKIAILGAAGMLGKAFAQRLEPGKFHVTALAKNQLDVTDAIAVADALRSLKPDLVINVSAFMNADRCEKFPEKAFLVNALGARNVSNICEEIKAAHLWFSSDFVFDGYTNKPYSEHDGTNPLSVYGMTKLNGETAIKNHCSRHFIIRTSSLYGVQGSNFIERMLERVQQGLNVEVVDDLFISPTYVEDLVRISIDIWEQGLSYGTYHAANEGVTSWHGLLEEVFRFLDLKQRIEPISISQRVNDLNLARRPIYSALSSKKLSEAGIANASWQESVGRYLIARNYR